VFMTHTHTHTQAHIGPMWAELGNWDFLKHKHIHMCIKSGCTCILLFWKQIRMSLVLEYNWHESAVFTKYKHIILTWINSLKYSTWQLSFQNVQNVHSHSLTYSLTLSLTHALLYSLLHALSISSSLVVAFSFTHTITITFSLFLSLYDALLYSLIHSLTECILHDLMTSGSQEPRNIVQHELDKIYSLVKLTWRGFFESAKSCACAMVMDKFSKVFSIWRAKVCSASWVCATEFSVTTSLHRGYSNHLIISNVLTPQRFWLD
jgi:uncharacterized membrane protein YGL010W